MLRYLLPAALVASPLAAEPPRAVTDIAPVQGLVASVMGELGSPEALVPSSASPHDHALSPSEARAPRWKSAEPPWPEICRPPSISEVVWPIRSTVSPELIDTKRGMAAMVGW